MSLKSMRKVKTVTRGSGDVWLVGAISDNIPLNQLPTVRQVLSHLFYLSATWKTDGATTRKEYIRSVVEQVEGIWLRSRVPTIQNKSIVERLEVLHERWKKLNKNASTGGYWHSENNNPTPSPAQLKRENEFIALLDKLFDISHPKALDMIEIEGDKQFLIDQRGDRKLFLGPVDSKLARKEKANSEREKLKEERRHACSVKLHELRRKHDSQLLVAASSSELDSVLGLSDSSHSDGELSAAGTSQDPPQKRGRKSIISPELVASLDRSGISDRKATFVLSSTVKALKDADALQVDPEDLVLNRTSIREIRIKTREKIAAQLKEDLKQAAGPFVLHWDGKIMADIEGQHAEKVERLPIIVTGPNNFKRVLEIPKLQAGTGAAIADAVYKVVQEYDITKKVGGISFDTTLSNTGKFKGAATLLEKRIGRRLVWLACRHHIFEIVIGGVFEHLMGHSKSPTIKIFDNFQSGWKDLDKTNFDAGTGDEAVYFILESDISDLLNFANHYLKVQHPRDDYREALELTILFIGGSIPDYKFKVPGPTSQARWMNKILYVLKICLFRNQLELSSDEQRTFLSLGAFIVREYVRVWFTAPISTSAPFNDLNFLKRLKEYSLVDPNISKVACHKFLGHLWYLSPDCVALALFDNNVSNEEKDEILAAMKRPSMRAPRDACCRVLTLDLESLPDLRLSHFASEESLAMFTRLLMPSDFLDIPSATWGDSKSYEAAKQIAQGIMVINDPAERGVCLMKDFNLSLTKDESTMQNLLKAVDKHRTVFPTCSKEIILKKTV